MIKVHIIPILKDNYAYVICARDGSIAVIDPGEAQPIIDFLELQNLRPDMILNTHHHGDHVHGNIALKEKYGAVVYAPEKEAQRITGVDRTLCDGDVLPFGDEQAQIIETKGHTAGAICYHFPDSRILFTGDTLFSMGCGRLFEGTAEDMFTSFQKIATLPDDTMIYCGHEYTAVNGAFCLSVEPENTDIQTRIKEVALLRQQDKPSLPVSLATEKKTNVFLRATDAKRFAELRLLRNAF